jgi:AhpD family alkylhydroperoxidase
MARISPAPRDVYAPLFGDDAPLRLQIYAQRPALAKAFINFGETLRTNQLLSRRLIELVRLRIAFHNQCRTCMAVRYQDATDDGVTEALVCSLEAPQEASDLTEPERAAIGFADLMATDHFAVDDAAFDELRRHFSEQEIMELCMNIGFFLGFGRMAMSLDMVDDLPDRFKDGSDDLVTPWGDGEVVALPVSAPVPASA